jgi:hypothetical protein
VAAAAALLAAICLGAGDAAACKDDSACNAPETCHFRSDAAEGLCLDTATLAITRSPRAPAATPLGKRAAGDICQFSVDCAAGMGCYKRPGTVEGRCYPGR